MCVPVRNAKNHSEKSTVFDQLTDQLGGLVLKEKQKVVVKNFLEGKDVFAVLPTGFGKSLISQSFIMAKEIESCDVDRPSCLVIVPHHRRANQLERFQNECNRLRFRDRF